MVGKLQATCVFVFWYFMKYSKVFILFIHYAYSESPDCPNLLQLAKGLNMNTLQAVIWSSLQADCCTGTGIVCNTNVVTSITWKTLGLTGSINSTALALMTNLVILDLTSNQISGSFPRILPPLTQTVNVGYNQLTGNINGSALPPGLQCLETIENAITWTTPIQFPIGVRILNLNGNIFRGALTSLPSGLAVLGLGSTNRIGDINMIQLPSALAYLDLSFNSLNGSVRNLLFPVGITVLYLESNQISDQFPLHLPSGLKTFQIDDNKMTGTLNNVVLPDSLIILQASTNFLNGSLPLLPSTLQILSLQNNLFTGSIQIMPPNIRYVNLCNNQLTGSLSINKPRQLYLQNNLFTNLNVADLSFLVLGCDISNNPLLGNPNITSLSICAQTGLYSFNAIPSSTTLTNQKTNIELSIRAVTMQKLSSYLIVDVYTVSNIPIGTSTFQDPKGISQGQATATSSTIVAMKTQSLVLAVNPHTISSIFSIFTIGKVVVNLIDNPISLIMWIQMGIKILIDILVVLVVIHFTPFKRELKKQIKKKGKSSKMDPSLLA